MGPAVALFQICHRLNAVGLTLIDETNAAAAFVATLFFPMRVSFVTAKVAIDRIANSQKRPG
jgi:hypothetical protein